MKLSEDLQYRGLVGKTTYDDLSIFDNEKVKFYLGVDPSSDSMTIGNLAIVLLVKRLANAGHIPFVLAGGATGFAGGDPDGKSETRDLIPEETLKKNIKGIQSQFKQILGNEVEIGNNADWFSGVNYLDFLRNIGRHFSMTQLLDRDFIKSRIGEGGSGINYAEFSYSLIQGYDFLHLYKEKDITMQICGIDQWGNCVSGMQMIRKIEGGNAGVFAIPLVVNKATGKKFGKSEDGAVWLDAKKTSPFKFYQFWLNCDDAGVIDYLKVYTFLDKNEIEKLKTATNETPEKREAQKVLAYEVTKIVHGEETARAVSEIVATLFSGNGFNDELLQGNKLDELSKELPIIKIGKTVIEALVEANIANSNGEARRLIDGNAISVNGEKINEDKKLDEKSLIKKGKNQFILVV